jgi:hypothetical protein
MNAETICIKIMSTSREQLPTGSGRLGAEQDQMQIKMLGMKMLFTPVKIWPPHLAPTILTSALLRRASMHEKPYFLRTKTCPCVRERWCSDVGASWVVLADYATVRLFRQGENKPLNMSFIALYAGRWKAPL